jgi:hypothetical protein
MQSAWTMNERPAINVRPASRGEPAVSRAAYVVFCGGILVACLFLTFSSLFLPKRAFPTAGEQHGAKIPVARIQFTPDQKGQCRHLVFHNDTGRFEESGMGRCKGLSGDEGEAELAREARTNAMSRVFKFR